jgi:hypothetical protein
MRAPDLKFLNSDIQALANVLSEMVKENERASDIESTAAGDGHCGARPRQAEEEKPGTAGDEQ